jgi:hypothetical protein
VKLGELAMEDEGSGRISCRVAKREVCRCRSERLREFRGRIVVFERGVGQGSRANQINPY